MTDQEFAREVVARLNKLIEDPHAKQAISALIEQRVVVHPDLLDHPTLQIIKTGAEDVPKLGVLGLLNGLAGVKPDQWGYVVAHCDDDTEALQRFSYDETLHD
jgi:hypothetical protein